MTLRILLAGVACAGAIMIAGLFIKAPVDESAPDVAELFDPTPIAKGVCGGAETQGRSLRQLVQLFATPAALAAVNATEKPLLYDNLGSFTMPVSTKSKEAQAYFDQGIRLVFGFNHAEAIRAFKAAQEIDPACAMCFWGEALALGPNINAPMDAEANAPAWAATQAAMERIVSANEVEKALITALSARYAAEPSEDRIPLDSAYANAMKVVHDRFPGDLTVATLFAEAAMDTQPWDYWESDFATPKGRMFAALGAIERVLASDPAHPGAIHLYIHVTEASVDPWRAETYADTLLTLMPGQGHLVHMPSHTYYRIGRFHDSLAANVAATAADEAYLETAGDGMVYRYGYYPHNVHFLMTSAQMAGDRHNAIQSAEKLAAILNDDIVAAVPWVQPVKAAPYLTHAQLSDPATILDQPRPPEQFPFVVALWHFTRGVAFAKQGNTILAHQAIDRIQHIRENADMQVLIDGAVPVHEILQIAEHVLEGRIAMEDEKYDAAAAAFAEAVKLQDNIAYTEPPYWYYPVRQSLGAALLLGGKANEAIQVFRETLLRVPNNGWALFGLASAYAADGDGFARRAIRKGEELTCNYSDFMPSLVFLPSRVKGFQRSHA